MGSLRFYLSRFTHIFVYPLLIISMGHLENATFIMSVIFQGQLEKNTACIYDFISVVQNDFYRKFGEPIFIFHAATVMTVTTFY